MSIHFLGKRKLYIVFMTSGGIIASASAEIDGDITLQTVEEMERVAAKSIGVAPSEVFVLNWRILEG